MNRLPHRPPARAEHAGSLVRPPDLIAARDAYDRGDLDAAELHRVEDAAIRRAVRSQEALGLGVVTDGHFRWRTWNHDVHARIDNVELVLGDDGSTPPLLALNGPLGRSTPLVADDFDVIAQEARATPKATLPSPDYLHGRGRSVVVRTERYADLDALFEDVTRVYRDEVGDLYAHGCRYIQFDDPNFAFLADPRFAHMAGMDTGMSAERLLTEYAGVISAVTAGRPADLTVTLHVSRGTIDHRPVAHSNYADVARILFDLTDVDGYYLDLDSGPDAEGLGFLDLLPDDRFAVLGRVAARGGEADDDSAVRDTVREATAFVPLDRLSLGTQCGFADIAEADPTESSFQRRSLEQVARLASEIWAE